MRIANFSRNWSICVVLESHLIRIGGAAVVLTIGLLLWTANGSLASETPSPLSGRWLAAQTAQEESQRLEAIDEATGQLRRMQRSKARKRLAERTAPPQSITIEIKDSNLTIESGGRGLELELGGSPIEVKGSDGKARVSATMEGEQLIIAVNAGKGERTTVYRAEGDRLSVEVTMTGAKLAGPVKYVSTYVRTE